MAPSEPSPLSSTLTKEANIFRDQNELPRNPPREVGLGTDWHESRRGSAQQLTDLADAPQQPEERHRHCTTGRRHQHSTAIWTTKAVSWFTSVPRGCTIKKSRTDIRRTYEGPSGLATNSQENQMAACFIFEKVLWIDVLSRRGTGTTIKWTKGVKKCRGQINPKPCFGCLSSKRLANSSSFAFNRASHSRSLSSSFFAVPFFNSSTSATLSCFKDKGGTGATSPRDTLCQHWAFDGLRWRHTSLFGHNDRRSMPEHPECTGRQVETSGRQVRNHGRRVERSGRRESRV